MARLSREDISRLAKTNPIFADGIREAERDDQKALRNRYKPMADALERKSVVGIPATATETGRILAQSGRQHASGEKTGHDSQTPKEPEIRQNGEVRFTIPGNPIGKPRQTVSDRWKKRPCVMRYRAWADSARAAAPDLPKEPKEVEIVAYLEMPASWSQKKRNEMRGAPHRSRPDIDNLGKSALDALFPDDSTIYRITASKFWSVLAFMEITVK